MKTKLINVLDSEYFKNRIKITDESYSNSNARLLGFYQAIATGLIEALEIHEKNNDN